MNEPRSCVLYARKSTDREDKQIASIPAQLRELREFAARSGLRITQELTESCSARKPGRPVFSRLLKDAELGRVERILAWRLDRLARNPVDGGHLIYQLGEGVLKELVTPEGSYTGAGDSKFMLSVLFGAATKMTDDLAAGVRRGNRDVLLSGRIPWRAPIGYIKTRKRGGLRGAGYVVPDPERFTLVQRMWRELLTGGVSVAQVWRRARNEWGLEISYSQTHAMFQNRFYAGLIHCPAGVFKGEHQPMVTPAEFDRVRELVKPEGTPRPQRHVFAYAGLLRCGACSRLYIGERHRKPSGLVFSYYRCGRRHQGHEVCRAPAAREEAVTADINNELRRLALPENLAAWTRDALDFWAAKEQEHAAERLKSLESELQSAEGALRRLTDLVVSGVLREDDFIRRRTEAEARIVELRAAAREPEGAYVAWRARVEEAITAGRRVGEVVAEANDAGRRAFLTHVCANSVVTNRITTLRLRFPFTLLENASEVSKVVSESCANPLPAPETVLGERRNARRRSPRERALSTWWTKVVEVRTEPAVRPPEPCRMVGGTIAS